MGTVRVNDKIRNIAKILEDDDLTRFRSRIGFQLMAATKRNTAATRNGSRRRIIVVVVPPVDELDLVGPLQVFN